MWSPTDVQPRQPTIRPFRIRAGLTHLLKLRLSLSLSRLAAHKSREWPGLQPWQAYINIPKRLQDVMPSCVPHDLEIWKLAAKVAFATGTKQLANSGPNCTLVNNVLTNGMHLTWYERIVVHQELLVFWSHAQIRTELHLVASANHAAPFVRRLTPSGGKAHLTQTFNLRALQAGKGLGQVELWALHYLPQNCTHTN